MSSAAQPEEIIADLAEMEATGTDGAGGTLRASAAERLAAHRSRRAARSAQLHLQELEQESAARQRRELARSEQRRGSSVVRDAVLARYETSQSYREFLAAEADRALSQAQAEAEVAARKAKAMADAQMQLLAEMDGWNVSEPGPRELAVAAQQDEVRGHLAHALADIALGARELMAEPAFLSIRETDEGRHTEADTPAAKPVGGAAREISAGGLTVKLYEDLGPSFASHSRASRDLREDNRRPLESGGELQALEQEIDFRRSPEFDDHVLESTPIPGNLIEFPRELIAPRRARPRLAEGPLREEADAAQPQLRIFEVEAVQDVPAPASDAAPGAPEWQSLLLEASHEPLPSSVYATQAHFSTEPEAAPLEQRFMAALVDACLVGTASLLFFTLAAYVAGPGVRDLSLPAMVLCGGVTFAVLGLLYQLLFFTFADWTPGMLYARIGLCTFGDRNPSRKAMRRRIVSTLLAACPLGLGLLWIWMDDDRLGWHDRMSRMYQRAY